MKTNLWGTYGAPDMTHTHVIHRHLQAHKTTFNLQSEIGVHTYWHARAPAEKTGVMDSGCLCVRVGISLILFFAILGKVCARDRVCECVCERDYFRQMEGAVAPSAGSTGRS